MKIGHRVLMPSGGTARMEASEALDIGDLVATDGAGWVRKARPADAVIGVVTATCAPWQEALVLLGTLHESPQAEHPDPAPGARVQASDDQYNGLLAEMQRSHGIHVVRDMARMGYLVECQAGHVRKVGDAQVYAAGRERAVLQRIFTRCPECSGPEQAPQTGRRAIKLKGKP